jgi:hypothetical protein
LVVGVRVGEVRLGKLEEEGEKAEEGIEDAGVDLLRECLDLTAVRVEEGEAELLVLEHLGVLRDRGEKERQ